LLKKVELITGMKLKKNESNTAMEFERALTAQELESY
jgi:hypothetical protein